MSPEAKQVKRKCVVLLGSAVIVTVSITIDNPFLLTLSLISFLILSCIFMPVGYMMQEITGKWMCPVCRRYGVSDREGYVCPECLEPEEETHAS